MKKLRFKAEWLVYRMMRNNMVVRMRANKATWARINETLRAMGQKQVMSLKRNEGSDTETVIFGWPDLRKGWVIGPDGKPIQATLIEQPKVTIIRN